MEPTADRQGLYPDLTPFFRHTVGECPPLTRLLPPSTPLLPTAPPTPGSRDPRLDVIPEEPERDYALDDSSEGQGWGSRTCQARDRHLSLEHLTLEHLVELEPDYDTEDFQQQPSNNLNYLSNLNRRYKLAHFNALDVLNVLSQARGKAPDLHNLEMAADQKTVMSDKHVQLGEQETGQRDSHVQGDVKRTVVRDSHVQGDVKRTVIRDSHVQGDRAWQAWRTWRLQANQLLAVLSLARHGQRVRLPPAHLRLLPLSPRTLDAVLQRARGGRGTGGAATTSLPPCPYLMYGIPRARLKPRPVS